MAGGVYCAECRTESEPGALYCTTCGRPLRRFAGPRGNEWGPGVTDAPRRRVWPWIVGGIGAVLVGLVALGVLGAAARSRNSRSHLSPSVSGARSVALGESVGAGDWRVLVSRVQNPDSHVTDSFL